MHPSYEMATTLKLLHTLFSVIRRYDGVFRFIFNILFVFLFYSRSSYYSVCVWSQVSSRNNIMLSQTEKDKNKHFTSENSGATGFTRFHWLKSQTDGTDRSIIMLNFPFFIFEIKQKWQISVSQSIGQFFFFFRFLKHF